MEQYKLCKTDHDSDCAVNDAPYEKGKLCNCGLMPDINKAIFDYIKITSPHIHEGERDGLASAFQAGFNFKSGIGYDIEYLLEEFKEKEPEYFDKEGKCTAILVVSKPMMELMRHLVIKLEEHIKQVDDRDLAF